MIKKRALLAPLLISLSVVGVWYAAEQWLVKPIPPIPTQQQQVEAAFSRIKVGATFPVPVASAYDSGFDAALEALLPKGVEVLSGEGDIDRDGDIDVLARMAYDTYWLDEKFGAMIFDEDLQEYGAVPEEKYQIVTYALFKREGNAYIVSAVNESKADLDPLGTHFSYFDFPSKGSFSMHFYTGGMRCWNSFGTHFLFVYDRERKDWFAAEKGERRGCPADIYQPGAPGDETIETEMIDGAIPFGSYPFPG